MKDVIIIGGGLSGLTLAIQLADAGLDVMVIERKEYPFHRVCGEYISNETLPFLQSIGADPAILQPARIERLLVSSPYGNTLQLPLDMGGFGVSRYVFDNYLYSIALSKGVAFELNTFVTETFFDAGNGFVRLADGSSEAARIIVGAFGKRSNLDRQLQRKFFTQKSPYIAVKYHVKTDMPEDLIALHNFKDGYGGISRVEGDKYCLCYMTTRENLKRSGTIEQLEQTILSKNPFLKEIFQHAEFLYEKPEVINEISFASKSSVQNHLLFSGDAAGMIAPLCGNGMAMALHASKLIASLILHHYDKSGFNRDLLEKEYAMVWNKVFARRLFIGRQVQHLFGKELLTDLTIRLLSYAPPLSRWIVSQTHGKPF